MLQKFNRILTVFLIGSSFLSIALAESKATLVSCNDGDTCRFKIEGQVVNVRFSGIDAPESDQPYGKDSRLYLLQLLSAGGISLKCHGKALGNRTACEVYSNGKDIQLLMVNGGMAFDYPQYSNGKYQNAQKQAMSLKVGMWKQTSLSSPYCWRWNGKDECKNPLYQP